MTRLTANSLLLLAAVIWGSAFVAQSTAMDNLGPLTFTGIRFLIAATVVAPFAWRERRHRPDAALTGRDGLILLGIGVVFFLGITIQQVGLLATTVTNAAFLTSTYVVLVPLFGFLAFRDRPHPVLLPAAFVTLFGIWLLGGGGLDAFTWGDAAMLVCAVFWALHVGLVGRIGARTGRPLALAFVQFLVTGLIAIAAGVVIEDITLAGVSGAWFELLYTSVLSGCFAFTLQAVAQRWTTSADAAILLSSESLFGAIFGALLLGEQLPAVGLVGCGLIFSAILAVQLVPLWQARRLRLA